MVRLTKDEMLEKVRELESSGGHFNGQVKQMICSEGMAFISMSVESEEEFLSLIWLSCENTRPVTPKGEPRTLSDVARRLNEKFTSLRDMAKHYSWFQKCVPIEQGFDREKLSFFCVRLPNEHEFKESAFGTFYLIDGNHRSLVYASKLLKGEEIYKPVEVVLFVPWDKEKKAWVFPEKLIKK